MEEYLSRFGVFIPINLPCNTLDRYGPGLANPPVPEPEPDSLTLARRGDGWGIFWTLADEEDQAPEAFTSVNWLQGACQGVGRRHILAHGVQYGEPVIGLVTEDKGVTNFPDLEDISRLDWTTKFTVP